MVPPTSLQLPQLGVAACPRRQSWLNNAYRYPGDEERPWRADVPRIAELLQPQRRSLIWLEAVDVNTVRAAVAVAQISGATLHVGNSTGSEITQRVLTSEGWLGTSLAEVASHADLIVTFGDGILSEAPLLVERFIQPAVDAERAEWHHICPHASPARNVGAKTTWNWPRDDWYNLLTALLCNLQYNADPQHNAGSRGVSPDLQSLSAALLQARNIVWLWDADEFCDAIDVLTIRRLLGICQLLSTHARCSLLCLDANVGRVTAHETLLWLTGCNTTARYDTQQRSWKRLEAAINFALHDWSDRFDSILLIETVPTIKPLPDLPATHYLLPSHRVTPRTMSITAGRDFDAQRRTTIAAVGAQSAGYLFRGDRGTMMLCQAEQPSVGQHFLPTAADVLDAVRAQLNPGEVASCSSS